MIYRVKAVRMIPVCAAAFGVFAFAAVTTSGQETDRPAKSNAQVWSESCIRCHNMISPAEYGYRQWKVIVRSMRGRANLSAKEEKQILEFFKSVSRNNG